MKMFMTQDILSYERSPKKAETGIESQLWAAYQDIGRDCKDQVLFESKLMKYALGMKT